MVVVVVVVVVLVVLIGVGAHTGEMSRDLVVVVGW